MKTPEDLIQLGVNRVAQLDRESAEMKRELALLEKEGSMLKSDAMEIDKLAAMARLVPHPVWISKFSDSSWALMCKSNSDFTNTEFTPADARKCPIITLTKEVQELVMSTKISSDMPMRYLRSPLGGQCYIHLDNDGKEMARDETCGFILNDEGAGLSVGIVTFDGVDTVYMPSGDSLFKDFNECGPGGPIELLSKALLYIGYSRCRMDKITDKTDKIHAANRKKGSKRNKAIERANKSWDYILIKPETPFVGSGDGSSRSNRPHFRRGHFRLQSYGPKMSKEKVIYIAHSYINGGDKVKDYVVAA